MHKALSLQKKIIATTGFIILTIGLLVAVMVYFEAESQFIDTKRQAILEANAEGTKIIDFAFENSFNLLEKISTKEALTNYLQQADKLKNPFESSASAMLNGYNHDHPEYLAMYAMDTQGIARVSTDPRFVGKSYAFRDYFKQSIQGNQYVEVALGKTSQELGYYFSRPITSVNGEIIGSAVLKLSPNYIENLLKQSELSKSGSLMFVDTNGIVLHSQKPERYLKSLGVLNDQESRKIAESQQLLDLPIEPLQYGLVQEAIRVYTQPTSVEFHDEKDGETEIVAITKVHTHPFYVVNEIEVDDIIIAAQRIALVLAIAIFAAAALAFIFTSLFLRRFFRPLNNIVSFVKVVSDGNLSEHLNIRSGDELENLAQGLNTMTDHLRDLYSNLEHKVQEQTKELSNKVKELEAAKSQMMELVENINKDKTVIERQNEDLHRFKLAVENASDHIVITDPDGVILFANAAVEKITGFPLDEVYGSKAGVKWGRLMDMSIYEDLWNTIKVKKQSFKAELKNKRRNGEIYYAEAKISPVLDGEGNVIYFVGIERDITKAKEVDRMKTEFISLASHQLRTPLSAMKWFLEMLLNGDVGDLTKEQKELVENINTSNERTIKLVTTLLNVSRIESGRIMIDPKPTNLVDLITSVVNEVNVKVTERQQHIHVSAHSQLPAISLDSQLIRQVILNLLTNAVKYSPVGEQIMVIVSKADREVIVQVTDNGYGIPDGEQDKVFQKFFRATNITSKETDGNGLGLYLVQSIIESSGGRIWFTSKEGQGTSFYFSLPLAGSQPKEGVVTLDS